MNLFIAIIMHDKLVVITRILVFFWALRVIYDDYTVVLSSIV